jgi:glutamyl-tRNA reductase
MRLVAIGTSHHSAPVELRERLAVSAEAAPALLARLCEHAAEAVVVSTCNRTELYLAGGTDDAAIGSARDALVELAGVPETALAPVLVERVDEAAAAHLFRVAAGLESLVPGEAQILGQVRDAHRTAAAAGAAGPLLDRLFGQALRAGRRVRAETAIGENPASVSSAGAELAQRVVGELTSARVLVIGAGETADLVALNLASRGVEEIVVANRSVDRAARVARRVGGIAVGLERVERELESADVVVSSTSAPGIVVAAEQVAGSLRARRGRPLLFLDLAVPRDLDPAINRLPGCFLYDVDDLEAIVAEGLADRRREASRAEAIVAEEALRFHAWWCSRDVVPAISSLRQRAEEIRAAELARVAGRLDGLSPRERRTVESLTAQLVNKLLHLPTVRLKEAALAPDGGAYARTVRHLFGLDEDA